MKKYTFNLLTGTQGNTNPTTGATTYKFIFVATGNNIQQQELDFILQVMKEKGHIKKYVSLHWNVKAYEITIRGGIGYNVWNHFITNAQKYAQEHGIKLEGDN